MPRRDLGPERRRDFAPRIARCFAERGYRRTTTAEIAEACGIRETVLFRLWPDKREMFIAAIEHVYRASEEVWTGLLRRAPEGADHARLLLEHEAVHHGEAGLYRILFAGLSETDDPRIRAALRRMYRRFLVFVARQIEARGLGPAAPEPRLAAWAFLGLGTVASLGRELGLLGTAERARLFQTVGSRLLEPSATPPRSPRSHL
jgi:AcrR family transcriptional regulator